MKVTVGGARIESKSAIKYLEVIIEESLNLKEHVNFIGEKASVIQEALTRIEPSNIGLGLDPYL